MSTVGPAERPLVQPPPPDTQPDTQPQTSETAQLAGEMHATEWGLGDLAHDVSAGTASPEKVLELVERLEVMARVLRIHAIRLLAATGDEADTASAITASSVGDEEATTGGN